MRKVGGEESGGWGWGEGAKDLEEGTDSVLIGLSEGASEPASERERGDSERGRR